MKNNDTNKKLTIAERMAMEAEAAGLLAQRRKILAFLKADETSAKEVETVAEVAEETPTEEVETIAEVAEEAPAKEVETVAEATEEVPAEEVETVAEAAEEVPAEEVETVVETEEEAPVEEVKSPEKVDKTSGKTVFLADEIFDADEAEKISETKENVNEEDIPENFYPFNEPVSTEDGSNDDGKSDDGKSDDGKSDDDESANKATIVKWAKRLGLIGLGILLALLLVLGLSKCNNAVTPGEGESKETTAEDTTVEEGPGENTEGPAAVVFNITAFKEATNNLIDYYGGNADNKSDLILLLEVIGEENLKKLCTTYGELKVQENVAHLLVFGDDAQMQNYIAKNDLQYNPNYTSDYFDEIDRINKVYSDANNGADPGSVLKLLDGYSVVEGNKEATIALIGDDQDLREWFVAKCAAEEKLYAEIDGTKKAETYRDETVKIELVTSNGTINLLKAQLDAEGTFELGKASDAYNTFISNNYKFVVAGR